jgi:integrative and conjugative element protein (TIGR02256 family)
MTVLLDTRARAAITAEASRRRTRETGGALFGFVDGDDEIVACAYGPGPRARHRRASFEPHRSTTEQIMHAVRDASRQRFRFLGSWHTHPDGLAIPSDRDAATAGEIAADPAVLLPAPLVLIQATRRCARGATATKLAAWRWDRNAGRLACDAIEAIELEHHWCPVVTMRFRGRGVQIVG